MNKPINTEALEQMPFVEVVRVLHACGMQIVSDDRGRLAVMDSDPAAQRDAGLDLADRIHNLCNASERTGCVSVDALRHAIEQYQREAFAA